MSFRVGNNVVVIIIENIRRKEDEKAKNGWNLHHWLCRFCSSSVRREKENFCWFRSFHWGHIRRMKFYIFIASPNLFTDSLPSFLRPFLYPLTFDLEPINNDVIQRDFITFRSHQLDGPKVMSMGTHEKDAKAIWSWQDYEIMSKTSSVKTSTILCFLETQNPSFCIKILHQVFFDKIHSWF